jgi:imidazole glycerol-phosphate synthase subunit HisH
VITIIDYGMGNVMSIYNMLKKVGQKSLVSSKISDIEKAEKLILPGVGAFDLGMNQLIQTHLVDVLNERIMKNKIPVLGICLGLQLFADTSEEGNGQKGLGWIKAGVKKFAPFYNNKPIRIPHMGWNEVKVVKPSRLMEDMPADCRFYFVHSYYFEAQNESDIVLTTEYGQVFTSGIEHENIVGVQFHPEKSHKFGMKLLKNFAEKY